jgi:hypothetical protein
MNVLELRKPDANSEVVDLLERCLRNAREGVLVSVGIVALRNGGEWETSFSASPNALMDAAMLMELAVRRLGFKQ